MRKLVLASSLLALGTVGFAAEQVGFAKADSEFEINRGEAVVAPRAGALAPIQVGDLIEASDSNVRIQGQDGTSVILAKNSNLTYRDANSAELLAGQAAFAAPAESAADLLHDTLTMSPAANSAKESILIAHLEENGNLRLQSVANSFGVHDSASNSQLITLGEGDSILLVNGEDGWKPSADRMGQASDMFRAQGEDFSAYEDDEDDDRAAILLVGGAVIGIAALAGGGYYLYSDDKKDRRASRSDRDDTPRRPRPAVSPVEESEGEEEMGSLLP